MDKPLDLHNDESVKPKKRFKKEENQMNVSSESGLFFLFCVGYVAAFVCILHERFMIY